MVSGVLFDFYDTLGYLEPSIIEAGRQEQARRIGVSQEVFGPLWRANARERMLGTAGDMAAQYRAMLTALGVAPREELVAELVELEYDAWQRAAHLYPDTKPALQALRQRGFKLGIVSNCSCQAGAVIGFLGVDALVDTLALSCEVGAAKPDPAIYQAACAALALDPTDGAFVADGAGGELEGARALGLLAIKIRRPNHRAPEDPTVEADHRVETLAEVLELVSASR